MNSMDCCSRRHVSSRPWTGFVLWFSCAMFAVAKATCPSDALGRVMMCTQGLGLGPPTSPSNAFVDRGQIEVAVQACRDKKLSTAVDCVEEITETCQGNTDQEHFLRSMVDVSKMRSFVTYFCSHLEEYKERAPCIQKVHHNLSQCVTEQRQTMLTKVKATSNMDFLMISTCKYFQAAGVCSKQVLTNSCGKAAADMVASVFQAFEPPRCRSTYSAQSSGTSDATATPPGSRSPERSRSYPWMIVALVSVLVWFQTSLFR